MADEHLSKLPGSAGGDADTHPATRRDDHRAGATRLAAPAL